MEPIKPAIPLSSPRYAPACDPNLPLKALECWAEFNLMSESSFSSHNVSVWLLVRDGEPEYVADHNVTIREINRKHGAPADRSASVGPWWATNFASD